MGLHDLGGLLKMLGMRKEEENFVVIGELEGEALSLHKESNKCKEEIHKLMKKAQRISMQISVNNHEILEKIEEKYNIPHDVSVQLNPRTNQILIDRNDADHLKIKYEDQSVHPEM